MSKLFAHKNRTIVFSARIRSKAQVVSQFDRAYIFDLLPFANYTIGQRLIINCSRTFSITKTVYSIPTAFSGYNLRHNI